MTEGANLKLPGELINMVIFHCDLTVRLQLRLVSKMLKTFVDSSNRIKEALGEIQINLHATTLQNFLELVPPLPFSNFYIEVSPAHNHRDEEGFNKLCGHSKDYFYTDTPHFRRFVESFCPGIRKLRVSVMSCCTLDSELEFFQSLTNLRELCFDNLVLETPRSLHSESNSEEQINLPRLPYAQPNLVIKRLVVDKEENTGDYLIDFIRSCPSLEVIAIPVSFEEQIGTSMFGQSHGIQVNPWILRLGAEGHLQHLRQLNMHKQAMRMDVCNQNDIGFLREIIANKRIRLEGISSLFLDQIPWDILGDFKERITSIDGASHWLSDVGFVNLEELSFTFGSWEDWDWDDNELAVRLPGLKKISAVIEDSCARTQDVAQDFLEKVFLPEEPRTSVTDLEVSLERTLVTARFEPAYLDLSFPNLSRLCFVDNTGRSEVGRFMEVISRKLLLEELLISVDGGIPAAAFFGGNPEGTPIFLRLKNLKKLKLLCDQPIWGTDMCERMGDGMLELLSRMSLTHLHLVVRDWNDVTREGIMRLVEGPLSRSVLWVRINDIMRTDPGDLLECLDKLEKVAHGNRVSCGLISSSYEQFELSKRASLGRSYPFRDQGWLDKDIYT